MIGAIVGDIVGSRFEFDNHKSKDFDLFVVCKPFDKFTRETMAGHSARQYQPERPEDEGRP